MVRITPRTLVSGAALLALLASSAFAACGQSFDNCATTLTCPAHANSGGSSGAAFTDQGSSSGPSSMGGSSGTAAHASGSAGAPPGTCRVNGDCDDQLLCTGTESCVDGTCRPGVPACPTPDPINCVATCDETNGVKCGVAVIDADQDRHGSKLCMAAPGDDCDDAQPTVFPGADEVCDGLDNDCDGKYDLEEGFGWNGKDVSPLPLAKRVIGLVWVQSEGAFAVLWQDAQSKSLISLVSPAGASLSEFSVPATVTNVFAGDGELGLLGWDGTSHVVTGVDLKGATTLSLVLNPSITKATLVQAVKGEWIVWHTDTVSGMRFAQRVRGAGALAGAAVKLDGLVVGPFGQGMVALTRDVLHLGWRSFDSALQSQSEGALPERTQDHTWLVSGTRAAPLFVWVEDKESSVLAPRVRLARLGTSGALVCGTGELKTSERYAQDQVVELLTYGASTGDKGYGIVEVEITRINTNPQAQVHLLAVAPNCSLAAPYQVLSLEPVNVKSNIPDVHLAGGDLGHLVLWEEKGVQHARVYGPNLCDRPRAQ